MTDHLQEPDEQGDIVDQTEMDLKAGPSNAGPSAASLLADEGKPPGHPETASTMGSDGEFLSRGGVGPAGPDSATSGTGRGTGADPDQERTPPSAPG